MVNICKTKDDFYNQHELSGGYLILTHSATIKKKQQLEEISQKLQLRVIGQDVRFRMTGREVLLLRSQALVV